MSKSRGREEKLRQKKKAERRKKKKLGNMKTPTFLCFFFADFNYKTGEKLRFLTKMCPPVGVSPIKRFPKHLLRLFLASKVIFIF